jgi:hypothetical protein
MALHVEYAKRQLHRPTAASPSVPILSEKRIDPLSLNRYIARLNSDVPPSSIG